MKYSIILPIYNEAAYVEAQIKKLTSQLELAQIKDFEIICIENGSHDQSLSILKKISQKQPAIKVFHLNQASYGQAIKAGIIQAKGKYIIIFNLDYFQVPFLVKASQLLKFVDIVIGSKTLIASDDQRPFHRRITTYVFNSFLRLVLNYPGTDTHGIKALRQSAKLQKALKRCRTKNELFDTELILRLVREKATLVELPMVVKELRPSRYSEWKRIYNTLKDLAQAFHSKYFENPQFQYCVVADDYGINPEVNRSILEKAEIGEIHFISILPNMLNQHIIHKLKSHKNQTKYSVHLNLIEGRAISPPDTISTLVNKEGIFYPLPTFFWKLYRQEIRIDDIETELKAQLEMMKTYGLAIEHISSHQHTHLFPPINDVVNHLAKQDHIKDIRSFQSSFHRLKKCPHKLLVFVGMILILKLKYQYFFTFNSHETIVHPGTNYD